MSKLIYTADLHGNGELYRRLLGKAEGEKCDAIVIGGDLCPRIGETIQQKIHNQRLFLEDFLFPLFKDFKKRNNKCEICAIMGNDDFRINMPALEIAEQNKIIRSIHMKSAELGKSLNIAGYSFVNPTPFRLKDWEKPDFENDDMPQQLFIEELRSAERENGTISEDLRQLKKLSDPKKTIYVIHAPPFNTNLDIVAARAHVGSKAAREFIEGEQPLLTLHGHIHESPRMSGSWHDKIGKTRCINVGSSYPEDKLNCVIIDANDLNNIQYFELK
ncbi:metallophosphoesterase family protein [Candidatus Woesearchaeota archaeon]|nr:metallophosphoesterase family protein [Candidatus Woesearchaeota archaeon]